ncbi:MAG: DedA family protein [Muribaculaceae bacterium]|nr:DedA family protein [Muribaculaceae bacterium]
MTDLLITCSITDYFNAQTFFLWFVENASYLFVFLFMVLESSFIPFPSEVVVPPAAYLATAQGSTSDLNIFLVVLFATLGALVGALINYFVSLWVGRPIIYAFADSRIGHACLIDRQKVDKAEKYFDEHGASSTFIGRLIPVIRQLISIPAGLARMNFLKFTLYTTLGALVWNIILALLGYWLARTVTFSQLFEKIEQYNTYLSYAGLALLVVCILYIACNAMRKNKEK